MIGVDYKKYSGILSRRISYEAMKFLIDEFMKTDVVRNDEGKLEIVLKKRRMIKNYFKITKEKSGNYRVEDDYLYLSPEQFNKYIEMRRNV